MAKRNSGRRRSPMSSRNKAVSNPVEQRSPNDQSAGGYDPEDYHAEGPVPVGNAPIHAKTPVTEGIPTEITASDHFRAMPEAFR